jgi:hypothetical protein
MAHRLTENVRRREAFPGLRKTLRWVLLASLVALAACAGAGRSEIPPLRSLAWFRYLAGEDIRQDCAAGPGSRYRLVYNAVWGEQVRDYNLVVEPTGAARLDVRILFPENLSEIDLADPLKLYRGHRSSAALNAADLRSFREALRDSGFEAPTPRGLVLPSDGYYWILAGCESGVFHVNGWVYPSPRFNAIRFDRFLFAHDGSGVAVAEAKARPPRTAPNPVERDLRQYSIFDLELGEKGLVLVP